MNRIVVPPSTDWLATNVQFSPNVDGNKKFAKLPVLTILCVVENLECYETRSEVGVQASNF